MNGKPSKIYEWVQDSSNPEVLRKFIEWSLVERNVVKRPPRYRMLVLSGHGSGAVGDFLTDDHVGNERNRSLSIPSLEKALNEAQNHVRSSLKIEGKLIDVLGMDSCLMSMAEVCYQVRESVDYLVGSEGFVQNAGWPYGSLLKHLRARVDSNEELTPKRIAGYVVQDYIAYYREYLPANVSVDMAACEIAKLGHQNEAHDSKTVRRRVRELTDLLIPPLRRCRPDDKPLSIDDRSIRDLVTMAHWRAQSYKFEQYTDLWDFCLQLRELGKSSTDRLVQEIVGAAGRVQNAIDESVGRTNGTAGRQDYEGIEFQHSHGLSVYFPWSTAAFSEDDQKAYQELAFGSDSGWGDFLAEYLEGTRRELRTNGEVGLLKFGAGSEEAIRKRAAHRNAPESGKNAPESGKNAPESGKNAPESGKMLALLLGSSRLSMKNPPQSVYLRPTPPKADPREQQNLGNQVSDEEWTSQEK